MLSCKVVKKHKFWVEQVEALQNSLTDEKGLRESVEREFAQPRSSVAASVALTAKFTESEISLEIVHAEVASLKKQVIRADAEKVESGKVVADVQKGPEKLLVRLNIALVGRNRAERLPSSLVME